jgi:uroporphyrinogen III methyltransferase/synthase
MQDHAPGAATVASAGPLAGRTVLVTRPQEQASRLSAALAAQGARPIEAPAIRIEPPESWEEMDAAIARGGYDWVVFTSANGVTSFGQRLDVAGAGRAWFAGTQVAAIGPETARTLATHGVQADLIPDEYVAEALVACIADACDLRGARILLPRADIARDALQRGLRDAGAVVDCVVAYRTAPAVASPELLAQLRSHAIDAVTFTSSSTVRSLVQMLGGDVADLRGMVVACIGPVTAASAKSAGLNPDVVADRYTIPGLVDALMAYFTAGQEHRAPTERTSP